ncbi:MAG: carboxymuconolactone decarboxylase family protein [Paracoccaceae bacterium]|nr:carboxymuconolactone decarboxylase family protein [Paracoccaceae bacterium]
MSYRDDIAQTRNELRALYKAAPGPTQGFTQLSNAVKQEGALSLKEKEYVAVGIAVAQRCEPCISFHVEALMKAGGSREELAEVLGMAIQMGGGPALMYAASALACWDELAAYSA